MTSSGVLFEQALMIAIQAAKEYVEVVFGEVVVVRDLKGRIRLVLEMGRDTSQALALAERLSASLGAYGYEPSEALFFQDEMASLAQLLEAKLPVLEAPGVFLLDRQIIGHDWTRKPLNRASRNKRITFHGLKGGVGRSTALASWSWHLAELGLKILVFDLDLESPGLSSTLLPEEQRPDYGIVDWFVEDGVSQGDLIFPEMVVRSPLAAHSRGQILVVPAYGSKTGDYLAKLARCYADFSADGANSWAVRLNRLVEELEGKYAPDLVLFDSRAGLHDIAGVLITRMDAECFLFAVDSRQTWEGYEALFSRWNVLPDLVQTIRGRLQMVAGLIPDTGIDIYLESFKENAWDLFRDNLYDEVEVEDLDPFSYDLKDEEAPHVPLRIFWHRGLMEFDPLTNEANLRPVVESAYKTFFEKADGWLGQVVETSHA